MTACDDSDSDNCSCNGAYEGVNGVPYMVDEGNLVGNKVEECEDDKRGDEPVLGDKGEVRAHRVQMQPAYRESRGRYAFKPEANARPKGVPKATISKLASYPFAYFHYHHTYSTLRSSAMGTTSSWVHENSESSE